jgi:hypothetical protein
MTYKYEGNVKIISFGENKKSKLLRVMADWMDDNPDYYIWDVFIDELPDTDDPNNDYNGRILYNGKWNY